MLNRFQNLFIRTVIAVILLIFGCSTVVVFGQQPNNSGKTQISDEEAAKKIDAFLAQWDKNDMPGCSVGAVRDGKLVYKRAFGMANLDYDVPNTNQTLFNVASAAKPFTAMSVALLAEQGKLSLDDDIRKYLPEMPIYNQPVTIRQLIYHTSGIREYQAILFFSGGSPDNALSDKIILNMLARQKNLSFTPGSKHQYSNSNYHLLGIIVGRVSGKSLRAFADENIFKPLGMKNTRFFDNRFEIVKNRAHGYVVNSDKSVRSRSSLFDLVGGGGILTTIEDFYLWTQNFYEPKVGSKELIDLLTARGMLSNGEKIGYSFGLFHNRYKGLPVIKHSGNMSGFRAQTITFPEQKFTAMAMCNNSAIFPSDIAEKMADIYLDGQLQIIAPTTKPAVENLPETVAVSDKEAQRLTGYYVSKKSGAAFRLSLKDGKLMSSGLQKNETSVMAIAGNQLLIIVGNNRHVMVPTFNQSGVVAEIKSTINGDKNDVFLPVKAPFDSPQQLSEYVGTYYSEEFEANHKLSLKDNQLVLKIGENIENQMNAAAADYFTIMGGVVNLSFKRDAQGKILGFVFNSAVDERELKQIEFKRR